MAQTIIINGNTYPNAPVLQAPKQDGTGMAQYFDTSDATATNAAHLLSGKTAYGANGKITGSVTLPTITQDAQTGIVTIS